MKGMSPRQLKVAEVVRHAIALAMVRGDMPTSLDTTRLTVADVWVSADLKLARVYLQLPPDWLESPTLAMANAQLAKPLRQVLARALANKFVPRVELRAYGT